MVNKLSKTFISLILGAAAAFSAISQTRTEIFSDSIRSGGQERRFVLDLPDGAPRGKPLPTVIALHGALMSGTSMRRIFGMDEISQQEKFAVAYPNGLQRRWNDGRKDGFSREPNDVSFIRKLAEHLVRERVADPDRLYLLGISNGGMMVYRVACEAPRLFAAYAAVVATMPENIAEDCPRGEGVPMLIINSTDDKLIPWEGGDVGPGGFFGSVLSTKETVDFWRRRNGCRGKADFKPLPDRNEFDGSTVLAEQYSDCRSESPVVLLTVEGGGHLPPGADIGDRPLLRSILGRANQDISAADVSWKFFKRFPLTQ